MTIADEFAKLAGAPASTYQGGAINQGVKPKGMILGNTDPWTYATQDAMGSGPLYSDDTNIRIKQVENGRTVTLAGKTYIVPQGTPLLDIIGQALVEAQLEK